MFDGMKRYRARPSRGDTISPMDEGDVELEPVFIAANVGEAELVEQLLETEGIEFEVTPEPFVREAWGSCMQGLMFSVLGGQAPYVRHALRSRGLGPGVLEER